MARIRSIKPAFFRHEKLQELGAEAMLVFAGLWTQCDSRGRFEWKPRHLKLDILPFMDFDMAEILNGLCASGFIVKYTVDNKEYGEILSFLTHQRITGKESESGEHYPENPEKQVGINRETPEKHPDAQEGERELGRGIGRGKDTRRESGGEFASGNSGKPVWKLICEIWGFDPKTQTEFKRIEALFRDFTAKSGGDLEKIRDTVRRYRKVWPVECSPEAVLKNWDRFQAPKVPAKPVAAVDLARIQREEQEEAEWQALPPEERERRLQESYADIQRLAGMK